MKWLQIMLIQSAKRQQKLQHLLDTLVGVENSVVQKNKKFSKPKNL
jgi:hypothetical protein